MSYVYDERFFDYIDNGARISARVTIARALGRLCPVSVLDIGCGRGAWLAEWRTAGVGDVLGVDGDYVARERLHIPSERFVAADLARPVDLGRPFDLVQSLEVAEHLAPEAAETLVGNLCRHGDVVLFSAAVRGQGGEHHLNERPLDYWRVLFAHRGYAAHDAVRPALAGCREVKPWYRYNSLIYANAAGAARLPEAIAASRLPDNAPLPYACDLAWRARLALLRWVPRPAVTAIARTHAGLVVARMRLQGEKALLV